MLGSKRNFILLKLGLTRTGRVEEMSEVEKVAYLGPNTDIHSLRYTV